MAGAEADSVANAHPLDAALTKAHLDYTVRNPKSLQAYHESVPHLPGGNTRTVLHAAPFPLTFDSGKSCELTTIDGDTYIDFLGEYTAGICGHSHPAILQAIQQALSKGWNLGGNNLFEKELAKVVCERFSPALEMVRFTNSGSEANLMAIGAAVNHTGRRKVLVFSNGYHGGPLSFPDPMPAKSVNVPHDFVVAPYNNLGKTRALLFGLQPGSLAAILVEPVQGSGGVIEGHPEFLHYLREAATEYGALLIFDEVMTSRLAYRGLGAKLGIRPDLMTLGKWVGGGMSFGAFGGRKEIMAMFDPRSKILTHSGTFNNNVISMAAGIAGCNLLDEQRLAGLNELGEQMKKGVQDVLAKHGLTKTQPSSNALEDEGTRAMNGTTNGHADAEPAQSSGKPIMSINGVGSMLCVHFSGPHEQTLRGLFYHHLLKENIYIASRGFMALNIELKSAHIEHFVQVVDRFVVHYGEALKP